VIRPILKSPDPLVRTVCEPVVAFEASLCRLALDLIETLHASKRPGLGLSANQIGDLRRVFIIDESVGKENPLIFVNPSIRKMRGEQTAVEGCLSLGVADDCKVRRAQIINWNAQDLNGNPMSGKMSNLMARIFQHELDHLDGLLIVDKAAQ
jgi:peptide deformylase